MRDTTFINRNNEIVPQTMVTETGGSKGIRMVLTERGLWRDGMNLDCHACKEDIPMTDRSTFYANTFDLDRSIFTDQCCARGLILFE